MKRAFEGTDFAQLDNLLDGPSAIAISKEDATAPIRVLNNVAKEAEALEFKGAVVEGTLYDIDGIKSFGKHSFQRRNLFPSCLVPYSPLSPILLVFLIRSLRMVTVLQRHNSCNADDALCVAIL